MPSRWLPLHLKDVLSHYLSPALGSGKQGGVRRSEFLAICLTRELAALQSGKFARNIRFGQK
jgi:hypothetical protein